MGSTGSVHHTRAVGRGWRFGWATCFVGPGKRGRECGLNTNKPELTSQVSHELSKAFE